MVWLSLKIEKENDLILVDDSETIIVPIYLTRIKAYVTSNVIAPDGITLLPHKTKSTFLFNRKLSKSKITSMLIKMGYSDWKIIDIEYIQLKPQVKYDYLVQQVQKEGHKYE